MINILSNMEKLQKFIHRNTRISKIPFKCDTAVCFESKITNNIFNPYKITYLQDFVFRIR